MTPYTIFTIGVFTGVILGFVIACLCAMAHTSDKPVDDAERWERIRQEMNRENFIK